LEPGHRDPLTAPPSIIVAFALRQIEEIDVTPFDRDLRMKLKTALYIAAPLLIVVGGWWLNRFVDIDTCLDRGGRWDYDGSYCQNVR
jgi:hypothetical protein